MRVRRALGRVGIGFGAVFGFDAEFWEGGPETESKMCFLVSVGSDSWFGVLNHLMSLRGIKLVSVNEEEKKPEMRRIGMRCDGSGRYKLTSAKLLISVSVWYPIFDSGF